MDQLGCIAEGKRLPITVNPYAERPETNQADHYECPRNECPQPELTPSIDLPGMGVVLHLGWHGAVLRFFTKRIVTIFQRVA